MIKKQFKCTLKSDVILNQKSASEGENKTLDFIPGNNFLGIVAHNYSDFSPAEAYEVFFSGNVRFGDAHPAGTRGVRTLRASASLFYPKLSDNPKTYYNYHLIEDPYSDEYKRLQLKQNRKGFYDYSSDMPVECDVKTSFSIKSAYDREHRRSKDSAMFGYEALREGLSLFFDIEADSADILDKVSTYLIGEHRLGRSRSAQYGLVDIEEATFSEIPSKGEPFKDNYYTVYADGRLIFLDEYGIPTFQPKASDLGFPEDAEIAWDKSQIRTFQYAPYNSKRKAFDADRCGIEKGSVFVVKSPITPCESKYIGSYRNEGFGKVIYNPRFLILKLIEGSVKDKKNDGREEAYINADPSDSALITILKERNNQNFTNSIIYKVVNEWAKDKEGDFSGDTFASQWGTIRSIATDNKEIDALENALFSTDKDKPGYLVHGVAEDKWKDKRRSASLKEFIEHCKTNVPGYEWLAVVNLASVMAKLAKK